MKEDRYQVIGERIRKLRESSTPVLSQEELGIRIGLGGRAAISKLELNPKATVTESQLRELCLILDCTEDYLRGFCEEPRVNMLTTNLGITKPYQRGLMADTNYSHYMHSIRSLSDRKLCSLNKLLAHFSSCSDDDLNRFDRLADAYFADLPPLYNISTIDHIESHVTNKLMPEITQSAIKQLRSQDFSKLDGYDWNDQTFHNSITQSLGDFMKATKSNFPLALKRSISESTATNENSTVQSITEQAIEYLSECIQDLLRNKVKDSGLYKKKISVKDYMDMKRNFPKYITRNLSSNLAPWELLIKEFLEKYEK